MSKRETAAGGAREESFLERWSRLKAEAPARPQDPAQATGSLPLQDSRSGAERSASQGPPVELPSIDELGDDSDYSAFLAPEVDEGLRRQALRRLFRSPKFNVCDGLDDYCEDFTKFAPLGGIVTADMRHRLERAAKKAMAELEESASREAEAPDRAQLEQTADTSDRDRVSDEDHGPA